MKEVNNWLPKDCKLEVFGTLKFVTLRFMYIIKEKMFRFPQQ